jgi:hypothetical protein
VAYSDWIYQLGQQPERQADFQGLVSYVVSLAGPLVMNPSLPKGTLYSCGLFSLGICMS